MVVVLQQPEAKEATMYGASGGGGAAARSVYRHALARVMIPLLAPLAPGVRWSGWALALGSILMSWDPAPTLAQRFESARLVLDAALPRRRRVGRTYQGFVKALARRHAGILACLLPHLRTLTERAAGPHWRVGEWVPIGADGSKVEAPRTLGNEALGFAGRDKCAPQIVTLLLVHLGSMLPWAFRIGNARVPERTLLRALLDQLPARTLLVADAGFTGFDLLRALRRRGVSFLIRVGSGTRLLRELGYHRREGRHTVYLWPDQASRHTPPLVLRLIRVGSVYLITDVTDPCRLSRTLASELYRRRWGLEVAFRSLKQTLEHRTVRAGTAAHARGELAWALVGLWVLALVGVRAIAAAGHAPHRLSLAAALAAVRHAAHDPASRRARGRALHRRLRGAVRDRYRRTTSRAGYRTPRKKRVRPPGPPRLATATRAQVAAAKRLRDSRRAA
jgi:hypothetical protein